MVTGLMISVHARRASASGSKKASFSLMPLGRRHSASCFTGARRAFSFEWVAEVSGLYIDDAA